ncbi:MAG: SDR family oxidoreductase [Candidatus Bathyarchaeota archaeon]|nr:SDR family oxidoreductase [Candidatus Bathyarchaeota archaeon]
MQVNIAEEDVKSLVKRLVEQGVDFGDQSVLVTGGAGFLGSYLCDVLVKLGAHVICIDNFSSGAKDNIHHLVGLNNFRVIEHDISQPIVFDKKIDVVMHLASRASPFEFARFPIQIMKANTLGTWVALGIAKENKARLVYASSSEIYGDPDPANIPTPETYWGNVNPVGPRSCYDEAKRAGEAFTNAYRIEHGLDTRVLRIFNTFGPRMRPGDLYGRVIPRFIDQALGGRALTVFGDGTQTRSFSYVSDTVEGIVKAMWVDEASGEVLNLGSCVETRIIDLAKMVLELTGSASEIEFHPLPIDDPRRRCPDISKARNLLDWEPKSSLEQGLKKTIMWFKERRS